MDDALQHRLVVEQVSLLQGGQVSNKVPARFMLAQNVIFSQPPEQVELNYPVTSFSEKILDNIIHVDESSTLHYRTV